MLNKDQKQQVDEQQEVIDQENLENADIDQENLNSLNSQPLGTSKLHVKVAKEANGVRKALGFFRNRVEFRTKPKKTLVAQQFA